MSELIRRTAAESTPVCSEVLASVGTLAAILERV